jgi:transposase
MQTQSTTLDFNGQNIFVGFDVHLKSWKVTIMSEEILHKTFVQPPNPELLHQYLKKNFPGASYYSAYEAGFCGYWIHNRLLDLGIHSIVVNPADVPTTNKEKVQKEDYRDSRKIARSLRSGDLVPIYIPSSQTLEDRCLIRARSALVKDMSRNKNRVKSFLHFHGIEIPLCFEKNNGHWSKRFIDWLEAIEIQEKSGKETLMILVSECKRLRVTILSVTISIKELSQTESYQEWVKLLRSIPGIGLLTAMIILTEIETITRFRNEDHLHSFVGIIPSTSSSGDKDIIGDITPRGHNILRHSIVESAWIAVRIDPSLMKAFHDYCKRMEANKAILRIAKKLLNRISFVLKNKQPYRLLILK